MSQQLLNNVQRETMSKEVANKIVELLNSGKLNPGDKLPTEKELMEMLSVSRAVLREALSSIESLGLITRKTNRGTYFSTEIGSKPFMKMLSLSQRDITKIMETRLSLELGMVTLAAEKINEAELKQLYETIVEIKESKGNYADIDKRFHHIIALSAKNSILEGMIDSILESFDEVSRHLPIREKEVAVEHHTAIYEALKNHSPKDAFDAMYYHLDFNRKKIEKSINSAGNGE
ncbi:FadR/GntR family transcriptional regulator [Halalkalibacter oceani]|uniref:FadR/GntR family transcriptional regulator n=1 Tax=Halalkalibacter oceani TaxID=1653776 RepID=UPI0020410A8D|nr:FadR/GntR family transcriptional regulator [Halalkalibacter oceani]MCM3761983.1 FadR family transcriptional regulator [Halalkalibacter oceani]